MEVPKSIAPTALKDWSKLNNALYQMYLAAETKAEERDIEAQFLELNAAMLWKKASIIGVSQYGAVLDNEDVAQTVQLEYLEALKRSKQEGRATYRLDLFKIAENAAKEYLSDTCCVGGVKIPYGTKKRKAKQGDLTSPIVVSVNTCEEGNDETGIEKRKAAMMSNGISAEDIILEGMNLDIIKKGLSKALSIIDEEEKDIILLRFMGKEKMQWADIGEKYDMTEGGARFKCNQALIKLRKECIKLELDACL